MSGIGILFCILIYIVLALLIISKAKTMHVKIIVLILAVLLPTADAVYGRYKLKQMCAAEAGLKVYRVAESVKGFMARTATEDLLKKYGYQFMEGGYPNHFYRFSLIDSEVLIEENVVPRSQYEFKFIKTRNKGYIKKIVYCARYAGQ